MPNVLAEFNHRYTGTIVGLREGSSISPIYIEDINYEDEEIFYQEWGGGKDHRQYDDMDMVLEHPILGIVNYDKWCVFVSRKAHRAYKRGLSVERLSTYSIPTNRNGYRDTFSVATVDETLIHSLYNPKYYGIEEALESIYAGKRLASAVSPNIAIATNPSGRDAMLVYKQYKVGTINREGAPTMRNRFTPMLHTITTLLKEAS